jgi:hypothetical protein
MVLNHTNKQIHGCDSIFKKLTFPVVICRLFATFARSENGVFREKTDNS